jgi:hypothetical protein
MKRLQLLFACLSLSACLSELEPDVGPVIAGQCKNEDTDSEVEVSFKDEVLPMLTMRCGCHDPKGGGSAIDATGFSIGSWHEVMRGGNKSADKIVVAGDACGSILVQKCSDAPPFGSRMPIGGPYFTSVDLGLVRDWIIEGAHDN